MRHPALRRAWSYFCGTLAVGTAAGTGFMISRHQLCCTLPNSCSNMQMRILNRTFGRHTHESRRFPRLRALQERRRCWEHWRRPIFARRCRCEFAVFHNLIRSYSSAGRAPEYCPVGRRFDPFSIAFIFYAFTQPCVNV